MPDGTTRKVSLLGNGYYSKDSEIKDGYPEFTYGGLKKLGWDNNLTAAEKTVIEVQAHSIGRDKGIDYGVQDFLEGMVRGSRAAPAARRS